MTYATMAAMASAGDVGKGGLANSKTVAYQNDGETALRPGLFVALSEKGGVQALAALTDKVAGVVVRSIVYGEKKKGETVDVMHIGVADSIFVEVTPEKTVQCGNTVHITAVGEHAGTIQGTTEESVTIETPFTVIKVVGNIAEITRL
ncbi:hypothetical protein V757_01070 [Pelistega indica]|uniref:Uncharacterized protein n=1 Tax=Pelistega indica TaxID=1414851 RepID=V8G8Y9_9BURK|nr:hypothetical protein [Pelistega indica]ETD72964.1 hypothetical protein V757_01070 [Pelistega indica]